MAPAQMEDTEAGKEGDEMMAPIARYKPPSYKSAGKLQVSGREYWSEIVYEDFSLVYGFALRFLSGFYDALVKHLLSRVQFPAEQRT